MPREPRHRLLHDPRDEIPLRLQSPVVLSQHRRWILDNVEGYVAALYFGVEKEFIDALVPVWLVAYPQRHYLSCATDDEKRNIERMIGRVSSATALWTFQNINGHV